MTILHADRVFTNRDGGMAGLHTGECKVVCRVETCCLPALKGVRETGQELIDRAGTKSIADSLEGLLRETPGDVRFGIGSWNDVDRFDPVLERGHDIGGEGLSIRQEWGNDFFAGGTDCKAVRCLIIGAKR